MEITEENFEEYFFDVRKHPPKKGQVLARFQAIANFVEGKMKQDIIYLLTEVNNSGESAVKVMRKLGCASEGDSIRIPREIAEDLSNGMSKEEVEFKQYKYLFETFYYTQPEYIPRDNPHWSTIEILNQNDFDESGDFQVKVRLIDKDGNEIESLDDIENKVENSI